MLKLVYTNADPKTTAQKAFIALYQMNKQFEHFWAKFYRLAQKAGIDSETTLKYLKNQISHKIKD